MTVNRPAAGSIRANHFGIERAAETIRAGGIVALPTETVYGLAADATNYLAVAKIFAAKGRPSFNPLISHVTGLAMAEEVADIDERAQELMAQFWPGPLTLVLPKRRRTKLVEAVTAGLDTVAVRAPAHSVARQLLWTVGVPLAAPSANPSGGVSPTSAAHVVDGLGDKVDLILDGGRCAIGLESTVVSVIGHNITLLRPGAITREDIENALAIPVGLSTPGGTIRSPGQLKSHYAPRARLRLAASERQSGEILIGFGKVEGDWNLSPEGDLAEAAGNLFAYLRQADLVGEAIAVAPIPEKGLGLAINDRLRRAAAPRDETPNDDG